MNEEKVEEGWSDKYKSLLTVTLKVGQSTLPRQEEKMNEALAKRKPFIKNLEKN